MEYVDGGSVGSFLRDGAVNILWGLVESALWDYRSKISKSMITAAISASSWVSGAITSPLPG